MNFRLLLLLLLLALAPAVAAPRSLAVPTPTSPFPQLPARRPNVVFILGDDHAAYALGSYGSKIARTPNLDRLAGQGARFTRAYCNAPVCTASRQSFLTGRMPQAVGVTLLATPLPEAELTLAEHLKGAGYATAAIGKMHFNSALRHGFDVRVDTPEHRARLAAQPPAPLPAGVKAAGPWMPFQDHARTWLNSECLPVPAREADMDASYFAGEAVRFVRENRKRPFFLVCSFTQPHSPFRFPMEYAGRHDPAKLDVPEVGPEDAPQIPLIFRDLTHREKQGINAAYYTAVEFLDRKAGEVLDALRAAGLERDTLVVYAGDHGYTLGHHGRFEKHGFYEPAVRVPLLLRWPGRVGKGKEVRAFTELVDLFPTVSEACGLPLPPRLHGKSLLPPATGSGRAAGFRDSVVSLYFENEEAMVRTDRWKLIYCTGRRARLDGYATDNPTPGRTVKLFDLEKDPGELRSVTSRHPDVTAKLKVLLDRRLSATSPPDLQPPAHLQGDERLDWLLVPPEVRRGTAK